MISEFSTLIPHICTFHNYMLPHTTFLLGSIKKVLDRHDDSLYYEDIDECNTLAIKYRPIHMPWPLSPR